EVFDVGASVAGAALDEALAEPRLEAPRQRDHAGRVTVEQLEVDARLAAPEALEKAGGAQLDEVLKALVTRGEERQVVALDLRSRGRGGAPVVDEVGLEAENRLDSRVPAG